MKLRLIYPSLLASGPIQGEAVVEARLTKSQIVVESGEVVSGSRFLASFPYRFNRRTGMPIGSTGWRLPDGWKEEIDRAANLIPQPAANLEDPGPTPKPTAWQTTTRMRLSSSRRPAPAATEEGNAALICRAVNMKVYYLPNSDGVRSCLVAAKNQKEAVERIGTTLGSFRAYGGRAVTDPEMVAVAMQEPGRVYRRKIMDYGGPWA